MVARRTVPCPRCGSPCGEHLDPFGYHRKPPLFACDNCEQGDSPDGSRAMGPLVFDPTAEPEFYRNEEPDEMGEIA